MHRKCRRRQSLKQCQWLNQSENVPYRRGDVNRSQLWLALPFVIDVRQTIHPSQLKSVASANVILQSVPNSNVRQMNTKSPFHKQAKFRAAAAKNSNATHRSRHAIRAICRSISTDWSIGVRIRVRTVSAAKLVRQTVKPPFARRWAVKRSVTLRENAAQFVILVIVNSANQTLTVTDTVAMVSNVIRFVIVRFACAPNQHRKQPKKPLCRWDQVSIDRCQFVAFSIVYCCDVWKLYLQSIPLSNSKSIDIYVFIAEEVINSNSTAATVSADAATSTESPIWSTDTSAEPDFIDNMNASATKPINDDDSWYVHLPIVLGICITIGAFTIIVCLTCRHLSHKKDKHHLNRKQNTPLIWLNKWRWKIAPFRQRFFSFAIFFCFCFVLE